jgi:hypothetical protein
MKGVSWVNQGIIYIILIFDHVNYYLSNKIRLERIHPTLQSDYSGNQFYIVHILYPGSSQFSVGKATAPGVAASPSCLHKGGPQPAPICCSPHLPSQSAGLSHQHARGAALRLVDWPGKTARPHCIRKPITKTSGTSLEKQPGRQWLQSWSHKPSQGLFSLFPLLLEASKTQ